jgi:hypothetical protein
MGNWDRGLFGGSAVDNFQRGETGLCNAGQGISLTEAEKAGAWTAYEARTSRGVCPDGTDKYLIPSHRFHPRSSA